MNLNGIEIGFKENGTRLVEENSSTILNKENSEEKKISKENKGMVFLMKIKLYLKKEREKGKMILMVNMMKM